MSQDDLGELGRHPSAPRQRWPTPVFSHLRTLTDERGIWEHARYSTPRPEHGYCTDDNARALVVCAHQDAGEGLTDLVSIYLGFVLAARTRRGSFHNRRDAAGSWTDETGSDDSQGRAWWGLGTTANRAPEEWMRTAALEQFATCSKFESTHLRANAYAALGAAEVLAGNPALPAPLELLDRSSALLAGAARAAIPWPEARLTYDNARIPQALIAAGVALGDDRRKSLGIRLLGWLAAGETGEEHFSFAPVGGRNLGDGGPAFDQQPLEAWAMADACCLAWSITGDSNWRMLALQAGAWLLGENDSRATLYDRNTGGTYDGLTRHGVNANQGAESTLAGLGTLQVAATCLGDLG